MSTPADQRPAPRRTPRPARATVRRWAPRLVALALVGTALAVAPDLRTGDHDRFTLLFSTGTGLYEGDDVKVLGVVVGSVVEVEPQGGNVRVVVEVDDVDVPADARAAIVAPSLVSGRFVQLAPAFTGGATLADGATVGVDRTTVPVSFDEVKTELTDLATALGPQGEGSGQEDGALASTIEVLEANLSDGSSTQLRDTLTQLRAASRTLDDGSADLFSTIENLDGFTRNLVTYDAALRGFTTRLAEGADVLDQNGEELVTTVGELQEALTVLGGFVEANRSDVTGSLEAVDELAALLADRSNTIAHALHVAPHSVVGLYNVIEREALTGRAALANLDSTAALVCGAILGVGGTSVECAQALDPLLGVLGLGAVPQASSTGAEGSAP